MSFVKKKCSFSTKQYEKKKSKPLLDLNLRPMLPSRKEILVFDYYPTSRYAIYFRMNISNILLLIHVFKLGYLSFSEVLLNWRVFITL